MGRPAVFVRLSRCIRPFCPWCDTAYAQGPGKKIGVEKLLAKILAFPYSVVVITGGEPYLQWDSGLETLEARLIGQGCEIQYETSGKVAIPENSRGFKVCSPKFVDGIWRFVPENIGVADAFKFVVGDDFGAVEAFVAKYGISNEKVWIMPLGASRAAQLGRFSAVWKFCAEKKFNFSPRLHILAFDNKKGV